LKTNERLIIAFKGLKDGIHEFRFSKSDKFFESIEYAEFQKGNIEIFVILDKKPQYLAFEISIEGQVMVICDRCLDSFYLPFEFNGTLYAKFSSNDEDIENDEMIYLSPNDFEIDLTHYIYESVCLILPVKRIHPDDKKGKSTCNKKMLKELDKLSYHSTQDENIDPRWEKLKNLNNN
jgi:uncharacterized metal-binding protein YceD (DUF177 family)